jgi:leukotriene-A4 hydrolase
MSVLRLWAAPLSWLAAIVLAQPALAAVDARTFAQPDRVRMTALDLDLRVSFAKHELAGSATLALEWLAADARELVLDTNALRIGRIEAAGADGRFRPVPGFTLDKPVPELGSALHIRLAEQSRRVRITYATSPDADGLQWLTPQQTVGGRYPFVYSQSEDIAGRSWVPMQDTPAVRFTYTARIHTPKALRAVMSADNDLRHPLDGDFRFDMPQRIPGYLLALAVGDFAGRATGPRSAVFAEPGVVAGAASEFADVETMIKTAEGLYGPYRWGRYDLLVMPPSFPLGGMENPRMTFATPTLIVGDRSLVSVVAHELAHSWSGNLVTMSAWPHVWLNEGFTTYVQYRIVESVYGRAQSDEEFVIATNALRKSFETMPADGQVLVGDPGDNVAYTKGAWFLKTLEARFGRDRFDAFLRGYFDHFAFQSIDTAQFLDYLRTELRDKDPGKVSDAELHAWLYEPGIPAAAAVPVSAGFAQIDRLRAGFLAGSLPAAGLEAADWRSQEWQYFLDELPPVLAPGQLQALDAAWHLTGTRNATIALRWYRLAIASGYAAADAPLRDYLVHTGRISLMLPLYKALAKTEDGKAFARQVYAQARPGYHAFAQRLVEKALAP